MFSMETFKDPEKLKKLVSLYARSPGTQLWGGFSAFAVVIFWMFSSGDFSFPDPVLPREHVQLPQVAMMIETGKSVKGISLKMMECYIIVFLCRLCAIIPFEGYLPFDKSGDWVYQVCEAFGLCLAGSIVYCIRVQHAHTYEPTSDNFNHLWIIAPCAVVSLILHPHLNNFLPTDIAWAFALYLESVTVLPQLFMFMKEGRAQTHTSHFLAAQALSRLMSFIFWASSFSELSNPNHTIKQFVGHWVVGVQLIQLLIMGDFIYQYVRCLQKGIPVSEVVSHSDNV